MTLILKPDLDIVVTYIHTKYEVNRSICSKVMIQKQRHSDTQTDMYKTFTYPLSRAVNTIVLGSRGSVITLLLCMREVARSITSQSEMILRIIMQSKKREQALLSNQ